MTAIHDLVLLGAVALACAAFCVSAYSQAPDQSPPVKPARETLSLDRGWRFHLGDIPLDSFPGGQGVAIYGPDLTHSGAKTGYTWGAAARGYDDTTWRQVDLPHDWVVEQPFDKDAVKAQGYRRRGIGWYRRVFTLDPSDRGRNIELQFDGVATHCTVYFNGAPVHRNWCGYTSFSIDVTPLARYGNDQNTVAMRVDADAMEGWWYEGGGIYRHTWLVKRNPVHIITDGVYANPVKSADGQWTIPVEVTLANTGGSAASARVDVSVFDSEGNKVAGGQTAGVQIIPLDQAVAKVSIPVDSPRLWSVDEPNLYEVRTTVLRGDEPVDAVSTACGFRTIRFDAEQGFLLNDKPLKLRGTCNHQDHAGVGVAVPDSLWEFRLRRLKEMGSNAYRTAHHPPSKELLDLCDRMGMLVVNETRHFNPSPEYLRQLEWLVRRDRNHPSVIMWSLFNEEGLERVEEGMEIARYMDAAVKRLDATRPTTGGQDKGQVDADGHANPRNAAHALDVVGINYQVALYDTIRAAYPDKPIVSTEDTSQVMTRGEYANDPSRRIVGSYDDVFWGWDASSSARNAWAAIARQPSFAGGFCWTGFDYRGEPTPYDWPAASSYFGCMDLCGFPKTTFFIRQAQWIHDRPVLTLVPHWNWEGKEAQPIRVMAVTNADRVALFLNGRSMGEKPVRLNMVEWQVPYEPGRLEAVATKDGQEVARHTVDTTGPATQLQLTPDRSTLDADGRDVAVFTVAALDADGRVVPLAQNKISFTIAGAGRILGVGNGDPTCHEPDVYLPPSPWRSIIGNGWQWKRAELPTPPDTLAVESSAAVDGPPWKTARPGDMPLQENETAIFRLRVPLTEEDLGSPGVRVHIGAIDDHGWVFINGQFVGEARGFQQHSAFDARSHLRVGDNVITVGVKNDGGPGGISPAVFLEFVGTSETLPWSRSLFNGLAQIIVQSRPEVGAFTLTASADGLAPAAAVIETQPCPPRPAVP